MKTTLKITTKKLEVLIQQKITELYEKPDYTTARLLEINLVHARGYLPTLLEICKSFDVSIDL